MFDLFRRRDTVVRYVLVAVLGVIALSMVITLIPGIGGASRAPEQVLAEVNGEPVTVHEVQVQLQQMMRNKSVPPEMIQLYLPQLIDQMLVERAVAYQAERMGFKVTDADTANAIRSVMGQLFPDGKFDKDRYERFLADQGMTIEDFESNIRKNLLLLRLRNIALEGVVVTPDEISKEFHRRNDKVKLEYVAFAPDNFKRDVKLTNDDILKYYQANGARYMANEKRSFDMLLADQAKFDAKFNLPETTLRQVYESNKAQYQTPERVRVRHILIKTTDNKDEAAKAEQKANDILKQLKGGANFAELAKKNSEDTGSAARGGDLDWVVRGQMVKPFETAAFSLKPHELSNLVKSQYGYHIVEVTDKEPGRLKPFEEVKDTIAAGLKKQRVFDQMQAAMDQAQRQLSKNPGQAEQIAKSLDLIYLPVKSLGPGESMPELGTSKEVESQIASLKPNEVTPVFQVGPTRLGVILLTGIEPPKRLELSAVENKIREELIRQKASLLMQQNMAQNTSKFRAPGADFEQVSKAAGLEIKHTEPFTSDGAAEGIGQATYVADAFVKPAGTVLGPIPVSDKVFMCKVLEKIPADAAKLEASRADIQLTLKRKKANERKELFEDGLLAKLIAEGKVKKHEDAIKKLQSSYRNS